MSNLSWAEVQRRVVAARVIDVLGDTKQDDEEATTEAFISLLTEAGVSEASVTRAIIGDSIPSKWVDAMVKWVETSDLAQAMKELF